MSPVNGLDGYENDPRVACRYGLDCYQKNEAHHEKFKHPPKNIKVILYIDYIKNYFNLLFVNILTSQYCGH